jgi:hypothetical protein
MCITDTQPCPLSGPFQPMLPPSPWAEEARKPIMLKVLKARLAMNNSLPSARTGRLQLVPSFF